VKTYEQVGERIRERLLTLGYRRPDGEPDVQRFCWDQRFDKTLVYAWLRNTMTPFKDLIRLCTALDCSAEWLLIGKERDPKASPARGRQLRSILLALAVGGGLWPSAGAAHPAHALSVGKALNAVLLIGSRWRRLRGASGCDSFTFRLAHA
jgi:hypothetical protein